MSTTPEEHADRLMKGLRKLKNDRGAMAELRRGASEVTAPYAWPYLANWCNLESDRNRTIVQTMAAAYATHPEETEKGNFGGSLRALAITGRKDKKEALASFEGKFKRLLICEKPEEVCAFIPGLVRAAKQKGVHLNYRQLTIDLFYWPGRSKESWAASFWTGVDAEAEA